ncbi:MAG: DNA ligase [Thiomicrorhabdus sp.]|jgi:DNA ligase-1|nr:DNA ligase [Thiomicrorhabdus sp.]
MSARCKFKLPGLVILLSFLCGWLPVHANDLNASESKVSDTSNVTTQHSLAPSKVAKFVPDLLLLKEYVAGQNVDGWLMSEKLDGVRAYWNGKQLMSRNGNPFAVPDWFTENFPPFELDGELWLGRHQFEQTMSIVNTQTAHKGWRNLTFQIFELPNQSGGLLARLNILNLYLKQFPAPYLRIIGQVKVSDDSQLQAELQRVLALNGEGLVVRNPQSLYQTGRSNESLKVKLKQDAECQVKGYTAGKGKYLGKVGALKCEVMDGQFTDLTEPKDRLLKIGSGLSDFQRAHPPKVGEMITFQYIGLTQKGLPRFAVFLRVRDAL